MILFMDDSPMRHKRFAQLVGDRHTVHHVYTAIDAIDKLNRNNYTEVFLDHDLGELPGGDYDDSMPEGWLVTNHIRETNIQIPLLVIHSMNPDGVEHMKRHCPNAVALMFGTEAFEVLVRSI